MYKKLLTFALTLGIVTGAGAKIVNVTSLKYAGPFNVKAPFQVDSVDVNSKKFDTISLLNLPLPIELAKDGVECGDSVIPTSNGNAIHFLSFKLDNPGYAKGKIKVKGVKNHHLYVDGKKVDNHSLSLSPATHEIVVKCLTNGNDSDAIKISVETEKPENWVFAGDGDRRYTLMDVITGKRLYGASVSPSGKYVVIGHSDTDVNGKITYSYSVVDASTGEQLSALNGWKRWMPSSDRLYGTRKHGDKTELVATDPLSGVETVLAKSIPEGRIAVSPSEEFIIVTKMEKGPEEDKDIYEVVQPEDRQPGWRNRTSLLKYDLKTGHLQPLTFGFKGSSLADISDDGNKILFTVGESRLEKRPTSLVSLYMMDLITLDSELLIDRDGFFAGAWFSPDGKKVLLKGTPEAFNSVGKNVRDGQTPSMTDNQLYVMDIATKKVSPLTRDFNPAIESVVWSRFDNNVYFTAENRDCISLYRLNPSSGKIENLGAKEDLVNSFSVSRNSPVIAYYGQGAVNSDRLYTLSAKNLKHNLIEDLSAERLAGVKLGKCEAWDFVTSRGDTLCARYILPADFDPSRKYPMIVNYYGGCNPTSRNFESRYPHHAYAAQGYVVLVVIPSGATGFGQEFSARHVNTAGEGVAEDIIEAVKEFTNIHPYVNAKKIGCIGASYGGFMTQYLQTKTDIFAAAISHAGISDHTSYWGEGYWGYSYSEVSMANSYPWTHPDLYVKQSPLYNADKVHTPLLFLHGDADTNVPVGESIQMYTALKLLGRETAFVAVKGENHHILDFEKRKKWQNTIFAWFAKYLQDDSTWWNEMYPPKSL
ncbi:MAG: prolyl oligopeptidase family serine peptidase [Muribaculum sp.]|nr:prolyl oligopeptidase family serine peptidase [Muribaculum sp.]